jgi:drug/metabolite transporter (DMT)-like permease
VTQPSGPRGGQAAPRHGARDAVVFVLIASAAFSCSGPLARWARPLDPLWIACGRCLLAGALLAAIDLRGVVSSVRALTSAQRRTVVGAGLLLAAHFGLFLVGLDRTSLPAALSLVSLEPLSVVLSAWVIHGVRPTRLEHLGVAGATAGALVVARGAGAGDHRLEGDLLVLGGVALFGLYVSAARHLREALPARHYAALVYCVAAVALAACTLVIGPTTGSVRWPPPAHATIAVVALALIPTIVGHTAVQTAARWLPPAVVALASPGETIGGVLLGAALLGAAPTGTEIAGGLLIVCGATIAILGARRASNPVHGTNSDGPRRAA